MKENILYWTRVLILIGVLLFILVSCTAWAHPIHTSPAASLSAQNTEQSLREQNDARSARIVNSVFIDF
jgi:hypothetical protein